ncbi:metalloregulator ArsR/SmtB family transcription factor [bacterium]|nr:metalloregulator ArsR/SmtB family transcription factor [bacterium]MCI0601934.1 metalloregulator ArsR/SmtB family transcription factor [bacterium]
MLENEEQAKIFDALSDPIRLRFVRELVRGGELSGTAIADRLGISLALLCHHSRILVEAGVITKRKMAQTAYFRANRKLLTESMKSLLS